MTNTIKSFKIPKNLTDKERFDYVFKKLNEQEAVKNLMRNLAKK